MTQKAIAITGGDAAYFDLMRDCIGSLRAAPEGRALALGILDCGLTAGQREWCRAQGAVLAEPLLFPEFSRLGPSRALFARAALWNVTGFLPTLDPSNRSMLRVAIDQAGQLFAEGHDLAVGLVKGGALGDRVGFRLGHARDHGQQ